MEWDEFWESLISSKRLRYKVNEMKQADLISGNKVTIEDICRNIYEDYEFWHNNLKAIKKNFLEHVDKVKGIHLQCSRIKSKESLLEKVIKKRYDNFRSNKSAYYKINGENYRDIVTDLIGMRMIINYRGKWVDIHSELLNLFPMAEVNNSFYENDCLVPHPADGSNIMAEKPKVYYASGDDSSIYEKCGLKTVMHEKGYRSIHYTISFSQTYIELQIRTIYDEAWSDCDHNYVYKQDGNKSHAALEQISRILCNLTNISNDIGEEMREIFEQEYIKDIGNYQYETTDICIKKFDEALKRLHFAYDNLEEFRNQLIVKV